MILKLAVDNLLRKSTQNYSHLKALYVKAYTGKIVYVLIDVILSNLFFRTKLLHAYVQCVYIVKVTYQIAPSKNVVGGDQPMKAPSMHIQKPC